MRDAGHSRIGFLCLSDSHYEPALMGGRCAQVTRPVSEQELILRLGFGSFREKRGQHLRKWHGTAFVTLRCSRYDFSTDSDSIRSHVQSMANNVEIFHSKSNGFSPTQARAGQGQHESSLVSTILRELGDLIEA